MLEELFDPISRISLFQMYVNDVLIDNKVLNDKLITFEVLFNAYKQGPIISGRILCAEELFTLSVNKQPSALSSRDTIKIVFSDNAGEIFERRFVVRESIKKQKDSYSDSDYWEIKLWDIYGYSFADKSFTTFIARRGYKGTPLKIVEEAVETLNTFADEVSKKYNDKKIPIIVESNVVDFLDNLPEIEYRFPKDKTPYVSIIEFARRYNIFVYQDYHAIRIIQNPIFSQLEKPKDYVYREFAGTKNYCHKICDMIKQPSTIPNDDRLNVTMSLNEGGKKQSVKTIKWSDIFGIIQLNGNDEAKEPKECTDNNSKYTPSFVTGALTMTYLSANGLIIYTRPILEYSNVGTVTSVQLDKNNSDFATRRKEGDINFSGYWFINATTLKIIKGHLIGRLNLYRYDNPKDYAKTGGDAVVGDKKDNPKYVPTVHKKSEYPELDKAKQKVNEEVSELNKKKDKSKDEKVRKREEKLRTKR